jgi:hypothetical protein
MVYCGIQVVRNRRLWQDLARTGHGLPSMASANRQTPFYVKCVKARHSAAGTGKSAEDKSDFLRAVCRLACVGIFSVAAIFPILPHRILFVCLARPATGKKTYE